MLVILQFKLEPKRKTEKTHRAYA